MPLGPPCGATGTDEALLFTLGGPESTGMGWGVFPYPSQIQNITVVSSPVSWNAKVDLLRSEVCGSEEGSPCMYKYTPHTQDTCQALKRHKRDWRRQLDVLLGSLSSFQWFPAREAVPRFYSSANIHPGEKHSMSLCGPIIIRNPTDDDSKIHCLPNRMSRDQQTQNIIKQLDIFYHFFFLQILLLYLWLLPKLQDSGWGIVFVHKCIHLRTKGPPSAVFTFVREPHRGLYSHMSKSHDHT